MSIEPFCAYSEANSDHKTGGVVMDLVNTRNSVEAQKSDSFPCFEKQEALVTYKAL